MIRLICFYQIAELVRVARPSEANAENLVAGNSENKGLGCEDNSAAGNHDAIMGSRQPGTAHP